MILKKLNVYKKVDTEEQALLLEKQGFTIVEEKEETETLAEEVKEEEKVEVKKTRDRKS